GRELPPGAVAEGFRPGDVDGCEHRGHRARDSRGRGGPSGERPRAAPEGDRAGAPALPGGRRDPPRGARPHPRRSDAERRAAGLRQRRRDDRGHPLPTAEGELVPGGGAVRGGPVSEGPANLGSAARMVEQLRAGEVSSKELVSDALERLETWQPVTNAFSQVFADDALAAAAQADIAIARAEEGALLGVPVAVKELYDVRGTENSGCCAAYRGQISERDADMVVRLRRAGAVIVGKTNQHELAADATNVVSACGPTHN